jgi:HNH endonuclease
VDHVIADKHGGQTVLDNLALSCTLCNRRKGSDIGSLDSETGSLVPLFNPRTQKWADHFILEGAYIVGEERNFQRPFPRATGSHPPSRARAAAAPCGTRGQAWSPPRRHGPLPQALFGPCGRRAGHRTAAWFCGPACCGCRGVPAAARSGEAQ